MIKISFILLCSIIFCMASESGKAAAETYEAGRLYNRYEHNQRFQKDLQNQNKIVQSRNKFISSLNAQQKEGYKRIKNYVENYTKDYYTECIKSFPFDIYTPMPSQLDLNDCYYFKLQDIDDDQILNMLSNLNMRGFSIEFSRQCLLCIINEMSN